MARKSFRRNEDKSSPLILGKKRKAEDDLEGEAASSGNTSTSTSNGIKKQRDCFSVFPPRKSCPLPKFRWAENSKVWENMIQKDQDHPRNHELLSYHPELTSRMRAILLDWLIEVCEVYTLHRDTFYLAQDCIDRYLAASTDLKKDTLQLLGITCLFIAAKVEEIYPPKLNEFAYVTDGACTEVEILQQEIIILMYLDWNISTITICSWLSIFLQIEGSRSAQDVDAGEYRNNEFELQQFDGLAFAKICMLLDLCVLDVSCLQFPYRHLAACAVMHLVSKEVGLSISGCNGHEIEECFRWMKPFCEVIYENMKIEHKCLDIPYCEIHNIQTHDIGLKHLEQTEFKRLLQLSPTVCHQEIEEQIYLTPPSDKQNVDLRGGDSSD